MQPGVMEPDGYHVHLRKRKERSLLHLGTLKVAEPALRIGG